MKQLKHWQDPVNAIVGVWLIVSPWVLSFQGDMGALANAEIVGVLLIAAALGAILVPHAWEEWTEAVLGMWLAVSPWMLGFYGHQGATASAFVGGLVVTVLALWVLMTDKDYVRWFATPTR